MKSSNFPSLRNVVHTGFNSVPGTTKFRQVLVYANPNFQTNSISSGHASPLFNYQNTDYSLDDISYANQAFRQNNGVSSDDVIVVIGDSNTPNTFAYGKNIYILG